MPKAIVLINNAIRNKEKIMIFGDYDVDGITSLCLLKNTLLKLGAQVMHYIPHRIKEGYGLNKAITRIAKENKIKLLITVDCGINSHAQIQELITHDIKVVITDHHEPLNHLLPNASAILNPKVSNSGYPYRELAGVGVAYKLCQALTGKNLNQELDLVALGTIADIVPLTSENRIIVKEGLKELSQAKRVGIRALIEVSRLNKKEINPNFVSFILGPRINASGRMDTPEIALKLLMTNNEKEALELAKVMEDHNRQRQKIEGSILEEAELIINKEINFKEHRVIVICGDGWHEGVLGIVASKIADKFYRPTIVISSGKDLCKGSGRSIKGFHLFDALLECRDYLDSFGGHAHAAGLLIAKTNIDKFRKNINRLANDKLLFEDLLPSLDIDMELEFSGLNEKLARELEVLEPFGSGNPEPLFYTRNLKLKGEPQVLARETLKFWLSDGKFTYPVIGFGMSSDKESLLHSEVIDLFYSFIRDTFRQEEAVILEAKEIFFK
jgi:single-stranded-DNA-specific exonuclease